MLGLITKGITRIFGTKSERDIKGILPYVAQTNEEYAKLTDLSNDELRGKTEGVKKYIDDKLADIDAEIGALHKKIEDNPDLDIHEKEEVFNQIDKLEDERNDKLEDVLMEVLAKAFPPDDLAERAFALYEAFRPQIPSGRKGWGAKGTLDLGLMRSLTKLE